MRHGRTAATGDRHLRTLFEVGAAGTLSDGQLLERFAGGAGAELAFAALVERHGPMVLRVARAILRDEHAAHDAFQATFLILARKARSLWVRDSLGPWLHAVACRVASRSRAAEARRRRHERAASAPETCRGRDPDPDRDELTRAIHEEIARLPEPFRAAVVSCHLEGLTQHEAARRLGWPVGTLQSRLDRGRRRLRASLARRGLAPALGTFAAGLTPTRPPGALVAATARAAATLSAGGPIAGMIGPAVLAIIDASAKGIVMTKLKMGAATLVLASGLIGSGLAFAPRGHAVATDEKPPAATGKVEVARPLGDGAVVPIPKVADDPRPADAPEGGPVVPPDDEPQLPVRSEVISESIRIEKVLPAPEDGPGFPVLLNFHATWAAPCLEMRPAIQELVQAGYPVKSIDIDREQNLARRYRIMAVPTFVRVDGSGRETGRVSGSMSSVRLADFYNGGRARPVTPDGRLEDPAEPSLTEEKSPRPWETVVRIKVHHSETEWGFGSGTVIHSTPDESVILTSAHNLRIKGMKQPAAKDFRVPISVDLFDGQFTGRHPTMVRCSEKDLAGEVVDHDFSNDVALIRIHPGRRLPASRVVPPDWQPMRGMKMYALGCSHGNDATAWDTTILDPRVGMSNTGTKQSFATMKCAHQPKEGRSGGGLYTTDGYLAGVSLFADPNEHVGLYALPEAIRAILDRNGLQSAYLREDSQDREPIAKAAGSDSRPTPRPEDPGGPRAGRAASASPELTPARVVSDGERRLAEVERKLDRIIDAMNLDALKDALKDAKGDFPTSRDSPRKR